MRPIDADRLIKYLNSVTGCFDSTREVEENTVNAINEQPTIDAVPVVRCKDCKYCKYNSMLDDFTCHYWDWATKENGYCHFGEKSEYTAREREVKYNNYYDKAAFIEGVKDDSD